MSLPLKSQLDFYNLFITVLQDNAPQLTDTMDGSDIDALAGVCSLFAMEIQRQTILEFNKTFIDLANGPEITGGPDDLQTLAVDHFGDEFERPEAVAAIDTATFSRANNDAGACTILAGTIVATQPDASGTVQTYTTDETVTLTNTDSGSGLSVQVGITAVTAGSAGDAVAGAINVIQTALTDSSVTVTNEGNTTGEDAQDDATYRETIRNLIIALRAATKAAIEAQAKTVSGVVVATAILIEQPVVAWNVALNEPLNAPVAGLYEYFQIPYVTLYIADSTGSASDALVAAVQAAIAPIEAYGVYINVVGASPVTINWSLSPILNPAGPNFSTFSSNTAEIVQTMQNYIATLGTGISFIRQVAEAAVLAVWGPLGTNDLIAQYTVICSSANATTGATYTDTNGNTFTVVNTIAGQTKLLVNAAGAAPAANGTLTKATGTGDTTITYTSALTSMTEVPSGDISIGATQNAVPGTVQTV